MSRFLPEASDPRALDPDVPGPDRGPLGVLLINLGQEDFTIDRGMRIAQLVFAPVVQAQVQEADTFNDTARGAGGFGSTGV